MGETGHAAYYLCNAPDAWAKCEAGAEMAELLTAAQMRAIEQAAIEAGSVTGLELMERAGRGVVEAVFEEWPELAQAPHKAVVLCGPGNNGGDGFVVARLLKEWGWEVEVFLYGDAERLPPDAKVNCERWEEMGDVSGWDPDAISRTEAALYVDAVFGAGLTRGPDDEVLEPLTELYVTGRTFDRLVAVDAPTGLCMDSGRPLSPNYGAVYAFLTVTFHQARVGQFLDDGPAYCGEIAVKEIGLPHHPEGRSRPRAEAKRPPGGAAGRGPAVPGQSVALVAPSTDLGKNPFDHKYDHGHALILSGGPGKGGAARLAARGALRIGAGLVTVGCPPEARPEAAARLDAIMCRPIADAEALTRVLEDKRLNALALGPGLGVGEDTRALVWAALKAQRATVLDADALTSFEDDPPALFEFLTEQCVLTPHAGEFARLFPAIAAKLNAPAETGPAYSKVDATREAAAEAGCVVLFKGPDTVIAHPNGRASINSAHYDRAAPWLATAGAGDVLAGMIAGLLARGIYPMAAAEAAAWLHVEAARSFGPGLIAEDLPEELPKVFRALGL